MGLVKVTPPVEITPPPPMPPVLALSKCLAGDAGQTTLSPPPGVAQCPTFVNDIFPNMKSKGAWQCASAMGCHGASTAPLLNDNSVDDSWASLLNYELLGNHQQYVIPCDTNPADSAITCNLVDTNACGTKMPLIMAGHGTKALTDQDRTTIANWLSCGAPKF